MLEACVSDDLRMDSLVALALRVSMAGTEHELLLYLFGIFVDSLSFQISITKHELLSI